MTKTENKTVKILAIHTKGLNTFHKLAWWNIAKVNLKDVQYIVTHEGKGVATAFFKLDRDKNGNYKTNIWKGVSSKNPYTTIVLPDGTKRVNFEAFATYEELEDAPKNLPKTKQGQANPLQVFQFDLKTKELVLPKTK